MKTTMTTLDFSEAFQNTTDQQALQLIADMTDEAADVINKAIKAGHPYISVDDSLSLSNITACRIEPGIDLCSMRFYCNGKECVAYDFYPTDDILCISVCEEMDCVEIAFNPQAD